jgi:hypothetical protein
MLRHNGIARRPHVMLLIVLAANLCTLPIISPGGLRCVKCQSAAMTLMI